MGIDATSIPDPQRIAVSDRGMISTQHFSATEAGVRIFRAGGNAVDAAVAAAFALGVCEPAASGLGGQTMAMIHLSDSNKTIALDGSSRAPSRASVEDFMEKSRRLLGHRAATVPSTPAVLDYLLTRYGTMPRESVMEPAISIAREGYPITPLQRSLMERELEKFREGTAARLFLEQGASPKSVGSQFVQPILAETLRQLAENGIEEFYRGEIAGRIEEDMIGNNGFIRLDDLAHIPYPIERKPISARFGPYQVFTFPPPGAGRTLIEMLNILSHFDPKRYRPDTKEGVQLLIETIRRAQIDRNDRPFDPNFYPQVEERTMLSAEYARRAAKGIAGKLKGDKHGGETTHLSAMDSEGNAIALTQSIERVYGSFATSPDLGFLYNNYMSAFDYSDISNPYYMRPNGVPWASVAPSIIFYRKRPHIVIGSPGSDRITSSILQVLIRMIMGQSPLEAVSAPRVHCSLGGRVSLEAARIGNDVFSFLEDRGYRVVRRDSYSFFMGCVQMVVREKRGLVGVADPRRDGAAGGVSDKKEP